MLELESNMEMTEMRMISWMCGVSMRQNNPAQKTLSWADASTSIKLYKNIVANFHIDCLFGNT